MALGQILVCFQEIIKKSLKKIKRMLNNTMQLRKNYKIKK